MEDYEAVESSNIDAVKYDAEEEALYVVFSNGSHYRYYGVPAEVFEEFMGAESKGKFFHANIRSDFPCMQIEETEDDG